MSKEEWLFSEISRIEKDYRTSKKNKSVENKIMFKFLIILLPLLFFACNLSAVQNNDSRKNSSSKDEGVQWKCKG